MDKAVVDRIVDEKLVVLLVGDQEIEKVIALEKLPAGVMEGTWIKVEFNGNDLIAIEVDEEKTSETKERVRSKMDLLRERSKRKK
ncbi:DUF3006 domain-containing protein [Bacillaceae bacterium IKA-2]|nr:DUF3006 domain-containing protein [Bacillaceae bacterium IKA-2]